MTIDQDSGLLPGATPPAREKSADELEADHAQAGDPGAGAELVDAGDTYAGMFAEYLAENSWITAADKPLVFHAKKLCRQLDSMIARAGETQAAKDSAYLQAVERLNRRRPGPAPTGPTDPRDPLPGQQSIYDEM